MSTSFRHLRKYVVTRGRKLTCQPRHLCFLGGFCAVVVPEFISKNTCVSGLDDDGDVKGEQFGPSPAFQDGRSLVVRLQRVTHRPPLLCAHAGGGAAAGGGRGSAAKANGYTCADCSALSQRKGTPTACPAPRGTASRLYSRDRVGEGKSRPREGWGKASGLDVPCFLGPASARRARELRAALPLALPLPVL